MKISQLFASHANTNLTKKTLPRMSNIKILHSCQVAQGRFYNSAVEWRDKIGLTDQYIYHLTGASFLKVVLIFLCFVTCLHPR